MSTGQPATSDTQIKLCAHQLGTVRPRSTSTTMRRPSILRPSAILYALFMSFLCSNSMKAYPLGLPGQGQHDVQWQASSKA